MEKKWFAALVSILLVTISCPALLVTTGDWPTEAAVIIGSPDLASWTNQTSSIYMGQTFRATEDGKLDKIMAPISGSPTRTYGLRLYDLGVQASVMSNYVSSIVGGNLLGDTLTWTYSGLSSAKPVIVFDFEGAEQPTLVAGRTYVFEITTDGGNLQWMRSNADLYAFGDSYQNGGRIHGGGRDFVMSVVMVPEPMTIGLLGLGAVMAFRRKK